MDPNDNRKCWFSSHSQDALIRLTFQIFRFLPKWGWASDTKVATTVALPPPFMMWKCAGSPKCEILLAAPAVCQRSTEDLSVLIFCLPCLHCGAQTVRSKDKLNVSSPNITLKIMAYLLPPPLPFSIIKMRNAVVKWKYLQKDEDSVLLLCMLLEGGYWLHWSDRICIIQLVLFLVKNQNSGKLVGCYQRYWEKTSDYRVPWMTGFSIMGLFFFFTQKCFTYY